MLTTHNIIIAIALVLFLGLFLNTSGALLHILFLLILIFFLFYAVKNENLLG